MTYLQISGSQSQVSKFMSIVREAFDTSVAWTPPNTPPVKLYSIHESTVPNLSRPSSAAFLTFSSFSNNHFSFTAEKYVDNGNPHFGTK